MGFVTQFFIKPAKPALVQLPSGSFMIDRQGKITTSTLPRSFANAHIQMIGNHFLEAFQTAEKAKIALSELTIQFAALKFVARNLRGNALIFVVPQTPGAKASSPEFVGSAEPDEHFG